MKTYAITEPIEGNINIMNLPNCLVVDDDMSVYNIAANFDLKVQPCTHWELMSSTGQDHFRRLHDRTYNLLWNSLPQNNYHRNPPPGTGTEVNSAET